MAINEYRTAFDRFLEQMEDISDIASDDGKAAVADLCMILRVQKLTMAFYESRKHELFGKGIHYMLHDAGGECTDPIEKRSEAAGFGTSVFCAYPSADSAPWAEEDIVRVNMMLRMISVFSGRNRFLSIAEQATYHDDMGYYNVTYFKRYLDRLMQSDRLNGMTAVYFNLKHFSLINMQIGRAAGTFVMRSYIDHIIRIVGENGIVAHIGGDNFAIIVETERINSIINCFEGVDIVFDINTQETVNVSATAGIYTVPKGIGMEYSSEIMDKVSAAAHAARTNEKEDVVYFNDDMIASKEKLMAIQQLFPQAIKTGEFLVYYQPKVSLRDGRLSGAEALCRWKHEDVIIPPAEFIPVLERSMDICKLDFYMLDHVCQDIRRWLDEGREVVRISVNLSRKHMMDIDLLEHIIEIIDRNNVPHRYIEIELTETTTDVEFKDLKRVVNGLQNVGIYTSVDDFGIGYSSLNLIKEIPWNVLKVDRSFLPVEGDDNSRRTVMFRYVIGMAQEMGLECIAEGVETPRQVQLLKENNCEFAQGFYFDKPLPVDEFETRMGNTYLK
ncbi:MAG: GGDEF domain-containing protein [Oscillospiraceae bacterium]|nr:GGDEF domain-containing protein [Oscillospiraceae bacterium]